MIDAGGGHAVAVRADGTAFAWGDNGSYAIGDGTSTDRANPVLMSGVSGITQVSGGETHTLLRRSDGRVLAVGANGGGRLGDGTTAPRSFPILSAGITTATAVSAGYDHSLVLLADGTVLAFGDNASGQLGLGDTTPRTTPTAVPGLSNIVAVSAGGRYSLVLTASGTVYAFGTNGNGQLGLGDLTQRTSPTLIGSLSGATAVVAGGGSSAVLLATGGVKTFGHNMYGQLGKGSTGQSMTPVSVSGLTDATAVTVGGSHMLARRADGTLVGWGTGTMLGAGPLLEQWAPIPIPGLANIVGLSAGNVATYVWTATGEVWSFGQNFDGRLGDSTLTLRYTPVPIAGPGLAWKVWTPTLSVAAGTYPTDQTVTVTCTDPLWAGATTLRYTTNGADPTASHATVACGGSVAVAESMTLRVNGWRTDAPTSEITTAAYTLQPPAPTFSPGTGNYATSQTVSIANSTPGSVVRYTLDGTEPGAASAIYSSPLTIGGTLTLKASVLKTGWTQSISGTASYWIASGTAATPTITPTAGTYTDAPMVTMATATDGATIRYTLDGTVPTAASLRYVVPFFVSATTTVQAKAFASGMTPSAAATVVYSVDPAGSAGTPTMSPGGGRFTTRQAVTVSGPVGATLRYTTTGVDPTASDASVASGGTITVDRAMVLKVRAFQSGSTPSQVRRGDFVITGALAGGFSHGVALKGDRTVWAWGRNDGALPLVGDGSGVTSRLSPVQLTSIGSAIAIAAGREHTLAVKENGTVVAWGYGLYGRLGDNTGTTRSTPTAVVGLTNVVSVAAGVEHSLAVTASGQVYAWGRNDRGQLGNNTTTDALSPVLVPGVVGAVAVAAGDKFSLVLTTDGSSSGHLWAFGLNDRGQLGDGTTVDRKVPVRVVGVAEVQAIAAGAKCAVARTVDGRLFAWGANDEGELGNGTTIASSTPMQVLAIAQGDLLEVGDLHVMITDAQARQWHWGSGGYGQPGTGLSADHPAPSLSTVVANVTTLGTGTHHSLIAKADGSVWSAGQNTSGALGIGVTGTAMSWTATSGLTLATNSWLATDVDGDGLNAWREHLLGTDPLNADTNGNGLPDGVDAAAGQPAAHPDPDGDGVPSARETATGTDPYRADTDGDGVPDGADLFPLDPTRSALPPPTSGDTTPPVITLIEPTNAVPIP
jgi:alpha-tubulin suppressor-like RCC1 family protein